MAEPGVEQRAEPFLAKWRVWAIRWNVLSVVWMAIMTILLPLAFMLFLRNPLPRPPGDAARPAKAIGVQKPSKSKAAVPGKPGPATAPSLHMGKAVNYGEHRKVAVTRAVSGPFRPYVIERQMVALELAILLEILAVGTILGPRALRPRCASFPLIVAGGAALLIGAIVWNRLFIANFHLTGFPSDIFRNAHLNPHAPMYGYFCDPVWPVAFVPIGLALSLAVYLGWRPQRKLESKWLPLVLIVFQVAMMVSQSWCGFRANKGATLFGDQFQADIAPDMGTGWHDGLAHYVERMPAFKGKVQHYPPGFGVIQTIGYAMGFPQLPKVLLAGLCALTILPLGAMARELGLSRVATGAAMALLATSASMLIFPTVSLTCLSVFFAISALWLLVRGVNRGEWWPPVLLGLSVGIYIFFTFAAYMVGLLMGAFSILALLNRSVQARNVVKTALVSLATVAVLFVTLYVVTHFNIIACFRMSLKLHLVQSGRGWDRWDRYLFRSTGALLAYLLSVGFPLSILGLAALKGWVKKGGDTVAGIARPTPRTTGTDADSPSMLVPFIWATGLAIVGAGFSGMSFLETERIWLFFSTPLAVLAGVELARRLDIEGALSVVGVIVLALVFSCTYQLYFEHSFDRRPNSPRKDVATSPTVSSSPASTTNSLPIPLGSTARD